MAARGVLRTIQDGYVGFWCPGCEGMHSIPVQPDNPNGWGFNGDYDKPTFTPSILVQAGHYAPGWQGPKCWCNTDLPNCHYKCVRCHSFVTNGQIQFLSDCTHALAGKTVPLTPQPDQEPTP